MSYGRPRVGRPMPRWRTSWRTSGSDRLVVLPCSSIRKFAMRQTCRNEAPTARALVHRTMPGFGSIILRDDASQDYNDDGTDCSRDDLIHHWMSEIEVNFQHAQ
jgi:hypothetical protein